MKKWLFTALAGLLLSAQAFALEPGWQSVDVNGDGKPETVAVTNLADIAFDDKGEAVGWFEKIVKGTDYNKDYRNKGSLIQLGVPSLVIPLSGTAQTQKPVTSSNVQTDNTILTATFAYTQGGAKVEKKYTISGRRLTIELETRVSGVNTYQLEFLGLGADPRARTKALESGAQEPITAGEVKRSVYASMQCCTSIINPNGQAVVVRPQQPVPAQVGSKQVQRTRDNNKETLEVSQILLTLPGNTLSKLEIYGGFDELVRLDQEKFASLPGLFQPNIFGQLSLGLIRFLEAIRGVVGSWGLAIIALTLLIRAMITPLLMQQYRSGAEMQALQPFLVEVREKHKGDPQKIQEETMKVYQANGVNPVSGCLPALIQMPVLLVLWRVFSNYEFDQGFLWIRDLSLPDQWYILPVLYVISGAISTWLSTRKTPEMFRQTMIIQFVFAYIYLSFPAGVTLYGVVGGLLGAAQQWIITQRVEKAVAAKAAAKGIVMPSSGTKSDTKNKTINTKAKKSS